MQESVEIFPINQIQFESETLNVNKRAQSSFMEESPLKRRILENVEELIEIILPNF